MVPVMLKCKHIYIGQIIYLLTATKFRYNVEARFILHYCPAVFSQCYMQTATPIHSVSAAQSDLTLWGYSEPPKRVGMRL